MGYATTERMTIVGNAIMLTSKYKPIKPGSITISVSRNPGEEYLRLESSANGRLNVTSNTDNLDIDSGMMGTICDHQNGTIMVRLLRGMFPVNSNALMTYTVNNI